MSLLWGGCGFVPMDFCGPYDKQIAEQYRPALLTPLLAGWEFWQKPTPMLNKANWRTIAKVHEWVLTKSVRDSLRDDSWAVIITDTSQLIQYVNAQFEQMTGYTCEEVIGRRPSFLQGEATSPAVSRRIREAIRQQKTVQGQLINYRKDRTSYTCWLKIRPILNRQKQVVHFIAFEQEVPANERKQDA